MVKNIQVMTTAGDVKTAEKIADHLVDRKLAACVQIAGPIKSVYRWKGKVEKREEWQVIIKTRNDLYADVEAAIRKVHPYEVPEIIALPMVHGGKDYLKWIKDSTK
jgi:periplasmic divalent cation tolerance protein